MPDPLDLEREAKKLVQGWYDGGGEATPAHVLEERALSLLHRVRDSATPKVGEDDEAEAESMVLDAIATEYEGGPDCLMTLNGAPGSTLGNTQLAVSIIKGLMLAFAKRLLARQREGLLAPFRAAGLCDDAGRPRRVLGKLPLTADGALVGDCVEVWITEGPDDPIAKVRIDKCGYSCEQEGFWPIEECYSSLEAAQSAGATK